MRNIYWDIFSTFFRIGSFTLGGGYAMIPLIQHEVVDRYKWMGEEVFIDMVAMAQSAPGVIAINTSIFVGYKLKGFKGSLVSALGSALPSFLIILCIAICFTNIKDNVWVERIFKGIRPAVVALIVAPLWKMSKAAKLTWKTAVIPIAAALAIWQLGVSPVLIVFLAIVGGIYFHCFYKIHRKAKNN